MDEPSTCDLPLLSRSASHPVRDDGGIQRLRGGCQPPDSPHTRHQVQVNLIPTTRIRPETFVAQAHPEFRLPGLSGVHCSVRATRARTSPPAVSWARPTRRGTSIGRLNPAAWVTLADLEERWPSDKNRSDRRKRPVRDGGSDRHQRRDSRDPLRLTVCALPDRQTRRPRGCGAGVPAPPWPEPRVQSLRGQLPREHLRHEGARVSGSSRSPRWAHSKRKSSDTWWSSISSSTGQEPRSTFFEKGMVAHIAFGDPVCLSLRVPPGCGRSDGSDGARRRNLRLHGAAFSTRAESNLYRSGGSRHRDDQPAGGQAGP